MVSVLLSEPICSMCQIQDMGVVIGTDSSLFKLHPLTLKPLRHRPKAHRGRITSVLSFNDTLVTASDDYSIAIWTLRLELVHRVLIHTGKVHALTILPNIKYLFSGGFDLRLCVYDLASKAAVWPDTALLELKNVSTDSVAAIAAFSGVSTAGAAAPSATSAPLGSLWITTRDGRLKIWHIESRPSSPAAASPASPSWIRRKPERSGARDVTPSSPLRTRVSSANP